MPSALNNRISNLFLDTSKFRIIYFISSFLVYVVYLQVPAVAFNGTIILLWGGFIFFKKYVYEKNIFNIKYFKILLIFLASCIITVFINLKYNFFPNLILIYNFAIWLFVLYGMHAEKDKEKIKKEMFTIIKIMIALTTVLSVIGFILTFIKEEAFVNYNFFGILKLNFPIGIMHDDTQTRFTGVYINPNLLAIGSIVSIVFSNILLCKDNNILNKLKLKSNLLLLLCIGINFVALILSDSNASFIFLLVYIVVLLFYKLVLNKKIKSKAKVIKASVLFLLIGFLLVVFLIGSRYVFQSDFSTIINNIGSAFSSNDNIDVNESTLKFGRPNHDLKDGSGRKLLIKQGLELFWHHPIMGIGNQNLMVYGQKYFENGIAFARQLYGDIGFADLHNGYLMILVGYGLIGFTLFMIFLFSVLKSLYIFLVKHAPDTKEGVFENLFAIIIAYCVYGLFEITILSNFLFMVSFLWFMLGYAMTYKLSYFENKKFQE